MANQNLSQFTEKLFVADADHTFIWDSAASISKRVSRNSWLNSGTLTSDAPVTISQTWSTTGVYTAAKVNVTETATANNFSRLLDLQVGGNSAFYVRKDGGVYGSGNAVFGNSLAVGVFGSTLSFYAGVIGGGISAVSIANGWSYAFSSGSQAVSNQDVYLTRDGAGQLALRNGAAAQTFNIYNTYQNAGVDYERIAFKWSANLFSIGREFGGTGGARSIRVIGGGSVVGIGEAASAAVDWTFSSGSLLAGTDNSRDIGASGANRPRNVYAGSAITAGGGITGQYFGSSAGGYFNWTTRSNIFSPADGVIRLANDAQTDFNRLQFGGTTNLFPAIKRSSTTLQARLADDSAFAPIQGKLTTDTAYTATVVAATGYITIYDSTGAAYRVPCAV